MANSWRRTH